MNRTEKPEDGIMPDVPPKPNETAAENPVTPPASDEMTELRQRAEQAERQRDEYLGLLKTAQADYENAHQRNRREREQEKKYAAGPLARDLLPALDNLERAVTTAKEANDSSPLAQGIALVHGQILD